jgi:hypothetical protein
VLVRVAAPVDEVDPVTLAHRLDPLGELGEVVGAVDDGPHVVARRPRGIAVVEDRVDAAARVVALLVREEPVGQGHACILADARPERTGSPWRP